LIEGMITWLQTGLVQPEYQRQLSYRWVAISPLLRAFAPGNVPRADVVGAGGHVIRNRMDLLLRKTESGSADEQLGEGLAGADEHSQTFQR